MIGPHWLEAHDQSGKRRLDNPKDSVRVELASALKGDIAVIPVLVEGTQMPSEAGLPDDLKPLARRHALELRHTRFNADADAIMDALEQVVPRRYSPLMLAGAGVAAVVLVGIAAVLWTKLHHAPAPQVAMTPPANSPAAAPTPPASVPAAAPASALGPEDCPPASSSARS
jgi:hypothetical protein